MVVQGRGWLAGADNDTQVSGYQGASEDLIVVAEARNDSRNQAMRGLLD